MKQAVQNETRRMTLKEVSAGTGLSYRTVCHYAQQFGWTFHGKKTLLSEAQATMLVEKAKQPVSSGTHANSAAQMQRVQTALSKEFRLALLYKEAAGIEKELRLQAETERDIAVCERDMEREAHDRTKHILAEQMTGTAMYQRIAEAGGLVKSDRDDLLDTYRRRT